MTKKLFKIEFGPQTFQIIAETLDEARVVANRLRLDKMPSVATSWQHVDGEAE